MTEISHKSISRQQTGPAQTVMQPGCVQCADIVCEYFATLWADQCTQHTGLLLLSLGCTRCLLRVFISPRQVGQASRLPWRSLARLLARLACAERDRLRQPSHHTLVTSHNHQVFTTDKCGSKDNLMSGSSSLSLFTFRTDEGSC